MLLNTAYKLSSICTKQLFNITKHLSAATTISGESTPAAKKKTKPIPKITLIASDNISITTVEEAQRLAKRRDLKLVKILDIDNKTQRPVYKLMTGAEYHAEDLKQREDKKKEKQNSNSLKGEKVLILSSNISDHDLNTHINKITKWINKRYEVRVVINGDSTNMNKAETVFSYLESNLKDAGRLLQKRQKGNDIKFQIIPPKSENEEPKKS